MTSSSEVRLAAWELASNYCDTSRDLFLRRVENLPFPASPAMRRGRSLHGVAADLIANVKRMIYTSGVGCLIEVDRDLTELPKEILVRWIDAESDSLLHAEAAAVWRFLHRSIVVALQDAVSAQPRHSADSLIAAALPTVTDWKIDGHRVGLSPHLSVDAFMIGAPMLLEVKTGAPNAGHRLQVAAYALAAESIYEVPFDLGAISYLMLDGLHVRVTKDLFIIDETLREDVLDARDQKIALIEQKIEPPISQHCHSECPFLSHCHAESRQVEPQPVTRSSASMPPMLDAGDLQADVAKASQLYG